MREYLGGCLCGRIRYRATGATRDVCFCHCASCRRASGAPMVAWATFDRDRFELEQGELAQFGSSPPVWRGFCRTCGTALTYVNEDRTREIDVTLASLDEPALLVPASHVWVRDKLPWVVIDDGLPTFETVRRTAQRA